MLPMSERKELGIWFEHSSLDPYLYRTCFTSFQK